MTSLLETLRAQAVERELVPLGRPLDLPAAAALIRDMPYMRASDRHPETIIHEWRGTCSGKHYALELLCHDLGVPTQLYHCLHRFTTANSAHFPAALRDLLPPQGLPDIHTFLRVFIESRWIVVDVTWPAALGRLGFSVNAAWDGVSDMRIAADIEEEFVVRGAAQEYKEHLLATHCAEHMELRDQFIVRLTAWLAEASHPR